MKVRTGFVSNSSSSSFLIYGVALDHGQLIKLLLEKELKNDDGELYTHDDLLGMEVYELVDLLGLKEGITADSPSYSEMAYIGASWDEVGDDETGKEFKARVLRGLKDMGLKVEKSDLGTHAEAWYDG